MDVLSSDTDTMNINLLIAEITQVEDPRLQWRAEQETMLRDYLDHAHDDLAVSAWIHCYLHSLLFMTRV